MKGNRNDVSATRNGLSTPLLIFAGPTGSGKVSSKLNLYETNENDCAVAEESGTSDHLIPEILLVGIINVFTDTLIGSTLVPILPQELPLNEVYQSVVLSSGSIAASITTLLFAWLSDCYGWLIPLSFFYPLTLLSCVLLLSAHGRFSLYLIARICCGFSISFMYPSNLRMVSSTHSSAIRATVVGLTLAGDFGSLCGPTLGGYLYDRGGSTLVFKCLTIMCCISTFVFIAVVSRSPYAQRERKRLRQSLDRLCENESSGFVALGKQVSLYPFECNNLACNDNAVNKNASLLTFIQSKTMLELQNMKCFCTPPFIIRALHLFFCWGTSVVLQVTLPYHWEKVLGFRPETVGLLFLPHLALRVAACFCMTYISDQTGMPLCHCITLASFLSFAASLIWWFHPVVQIIPTITSSVLLGLGIGMADSCTFAWASVYSSKLSQAAWQTNHSTKFPADLGEAPYHGSGVLNPPNLYEGRAFALMSVACDLGIFTLPIFVSMLTQYTFADAFTFLAFLGAVIFVCCCYCSYKESVEV